MVVQRGTGKMKIRIEIDESLTEDEVIIRTGNLGEHVDAIQKAVKEAGGARQKFVFCKEETEYYLPLESIAFFETGGSGVYAHTADDMFTVRLRLYELEEALPGFFMRVSKSTILNLRFVYALTRSISGTCLVQMQGTHKQVYVSRYYYKPLKERLEGKR